ncbi:MAG: ribosome maturation factor RimP, partial [Ectopseudomonas oleovorans]
LSQGRHSLLRVYIDKADGILIDDCEIVSRQLSGVLDVEDPITSEYTLEVSSPGMDRPLFTLEQFATHAGEQVKIKLRSPFDGRRNFQGLLRGVEEQDVVVQVDDHEYLLPIDLIDKANIIPRFD